MVDYNPLNSKAVLNLIEQLDQQYVQRWDLVCHYNATEFSLVHAQTNTLLTLDESSAGNIPFVKINDTEITRYLIQLDLHQQVVDAAIGMLEALQNRSIERFNTAFK